MYSRGEEDSVLYIYIQARGEGDLFPGVIKKYCDFSRRVLKTVQPLLMIKGWSAFEELLRKGVWLLLFFLLRLTGMYLYFFRQLFRI